MKINRSFRRKRVSSPRAVAARAVLSFAVVVGAGFVDIIRAAEPTSPPAEYAEYAEPTAPTTEVDLSAFAPIDDGFPTTVRRDLPALESIWAELAPTSNAPPSRPARRFAPFANAVDFQLRKQGPAYRGKLLAVRGRLLRGVFVPTPTPDAPDAGFFDLWVLLPDSKRDPVRLLTRTAPKSFVPDARLENAVPYSRDVRYRRETVDALAVYYRTTAFDAGDDLFAAPTLVAFGFRFADGPTDGAKSETNGANGANDAAERSTARGIGVKIGLVVALVAGWLALRRRFGGKGPRRPKKSPDLPETLGPLAVWLVAFAASTPGFAEDADAPTPTDFWSTVAGVASDVWRRETTARAPSFADSSASERRRIAETLLDRAARIVSADALAPFCPAFGDPATPNLGAFVATTPERRPADVPDASVRPFVGTVVEIARLPDSPLSRVVVESESPAGERVVVYSATVPRFAAAPNFFAGKRDSGGASTGGVGERVGGVGVRFGSEPDVSTGDSTGDSTGGDGSGSAPVPVLLSTRVGWYPSDAPLGRLGVDLSSFDAVPVFPLDALQRETDPARKRAVARSLRLTSADREPFYQSLAAIARLPKTPKTPKTPKSPETSKTSKTSKTPESPEPPVFDFFARPESNRGRVLTGRGVVRRANLILVDDPEVRAATGVERYFQLFVFPNESPTLPLVLCVPALPDGLPTGGGDDYRFEIDFSGFLYKTWAYKTGGRAADALADAADSPKSWARVPLLIGKVTSVFPPDADSSPRSPISPTGIFGAFVVLAVAYVALRRFASRSSPCSSPRR